MAIFNNVISESTKYVTIRILVVTRNMADRDWNDSPAAGKRQRAVLIHVFQSANLALEARHIYVVPKAAEVVRRIFRRYTETQSPKLIALELNKEGILNKVGKGWNMNGTGTSSPTDGQRIDAHLILTIYDSSDWVNQFLIPAIEAEKNGIGIFYFDEEKAGRYRTLSQKGGRIPTGFVHTIDDVGSPVKGFFKKITETLQFRRWFKDSKVVDDEGKPLVVYHGTDADFNVFNMDKSRANMDIRGAFFSPWEDDARGYGKNVRSFYLSLQNPADEDTAYRALRMFQGQNNAGVKAREFLIRQGYDGVNFGNQEYIAFYPNQIKSETDNIGTFDPENNDIRFSVPVPASDEFSGNNEINLSARVEAPPVQTKKAYKLFNVDVNGNPHALFIDRANALELGVWYNADSPHIKDLENLPANKTYLVDKDGTATVAKFNNKNDAPSKNDLDVAALAGSRYIWIGTSRQKGKVFGKRTYYNWGLNGSGTAAKYAMRPGWHATNVPAARHIGAQGDSGKIEYRRPDQRWFEIEMAADKNYNEEAAKNPNGDIPDHIPSDGVYWFTTNTNADEKQDWYITGAIRIVRPLSESEAHQIAREMGYREDLPYRDGIKNFAEDDFENEPFGRIADALLKIIDGEEEVIIKDLRSDLFAYGGTNDITLMWGNEKKG